MLVNELGISYITNPLTGHWEGKKVDDKFYVDSL